MSLSNNTENDVLAMLLLGDDPAWRAGATAYLTLHTADPGEAGTAITSECAYGGYARVAITKATFWTDGGSSFSNAVLAQWPVCSSGSETAQYFGVVTTASGAGQLIGSGQLGANIAISAPIQPQANIGALVVTMN